MDVDLQSAAVDLKLRRRQELSLSALLIVQMLIMFVAGPLLDNLDGRYRWVMNVLVSLMIVISIFMVSHSAIRRMSIVSFGLCFTGLLIGPFLTDHKISEILITIVSLVFCITLSWIVAAMIAGAKRVTLHHIRAALVIYLNIALGFAIAYNFLEVEAPGAFANAARSHQDYIGSMIYFSLTTLTTTGYGDVLPVSPFARSLANLEAVVGQFYLATLIATLVGLHVSHRQNVHGA